MIDPRLDGSIRYPQDATAPGMWHARLVRSPHPCARVVAIDTSMVPDGVVVLGPQDVADLGAYGCQISDEPVLAATPRHVGDPVVAVAAASPQLAREAAEAVLVDYEPLPAVFDEREAVEPDAPLVHAEHAVSDRDSAYFGIRPLKGTNVCHRFRIRTPALPDDEGFSAADVVVDETFHTAGAQHVAMEPHACLARWRGGRLELITGTQTPFNVRQEIARLFDLPVEDVRVICPPMGGAFGAKTFVRLEAMSAALARAAGQPVKLVLDRDEEWVTLNRHPATVRVRLGATRDGRFVAIRLWCWVNTGAYADCGPGVAQKMGYAGVGPYRFGHVAVDSSCVYTHLPPAGAFRGYGAMQSIWARERAVDMMADALAVDPLELRRRNLLRDGDVFCTGEVMHDVRFAELLDDVAKAVDWQSGRHGKGLAVMLKGMQTPSRAEVEVHRLADGRFEVRSATTEMGQDSTRTIALLAADLLGVDPSQVSVPPPDTDRSPYDTRTTSSRSTHMMGRALVEAVRDLERNGTVGHGEARSEGGLDPDTGQGIASSHWHQGAASAAVDVDDETGRITVRALHASCYAGKVVNRPGAELQNEGSMTMALGTALFEEIVFEDGQVVGPNLSDYNIPSALDSRGVTHTLLEHEGAEVHGLGETALPPVPPAIGNAVATLGYHPTRLPMTPERVLERRR